ncbi:hypothetical protein [Burkholderia lata]|uniref:hypothetical protein n=1 Tax=Burkholderia lata (strain ATCC 17760 / DSM 23089 / LMG 22485 / NCIMB 9086 / R18194 / 383) TaxID=482957 RepID=UPI001583092C|nr:hypothetical protein [Burkholderia lata]
MQYFPFSEDALNRKARFCGLFCFATTDNPFKSVMRKNRADGLVADVRKFHARGDLDFSAIPRLERSRLPAGLRHDPNKYLFKIKWLLSGCQVGCALVPGARKAALQPVQPLRLGGNRQPASRDTPGLVYLGGHFVEDKLDLYRSEMRERIGWCFVPPQILYQLTAMMTHPADKPAGRTHWPRLDARFLGVTVGCNFPGGGGINQSKIFAVPIVGQISVGVDTWPLECSSRLD